MKKKYIFVLLMLISITFISFCGTFFYLKLNNNELETAADELIVMTSCNPVYLATLNVVGDVDGVTVTNLSQPTTGCLHDYTLTTEDMKNLSKADVLVVNGGGMEGYLDDVVSAYPDLPIIDTFEYIEHETNLFEELGVEIEEDEHEEADEALEAEAANAETEEGHDHGDVNSHIWMNETLYAAQLRAIASELSQMDSAHADAYAENAKSFISYMDAGIDKQGLDETLNGANVAILHEAFEYTALSLNANVVATMDLDEERQVSAGEVKEFIDAIIANDVEIVFAEYDYGNAMGDLIMEQTDAKVVYLETLVHGSYDTDDYVKVLNSNYNLIDEKINR